jgi:hypothetical protein
METIIIKVKDEKSKEIVKSLLSKMKSVEIVEPSYNGFVKGEYKEGEEITDFFKPKKDVSSIDSVKEAKELRRKAWRL